MRSDQERAALDNEAPPRWRARRWPPGTPAGQGRLPGRAGFKALAGSTAALILASLLAVGLAFGAKEACRAGGWNTGVEQYQAHCYTDIYPLYFFEGLSAGKVPYVGHHVEYPVVMGAAMESAAWVVHRIANPAIRGREFYDVTVILLGLCLVAGVL